MSNVKLAIRVRPFTEKESRTEKERVPIVNVVDQHTVTITNVKVSLSGAGDSRERVRRYFADYAFNSACPVTHPEYASQEMVFETLGRQVISTICRGQSACVLTYGQSATGKTHTMMGSTGQAGLIPRLCNALANEKLFDITVSFLEIYNERVHDLLAGEPNLPLNSLPRRKGNVRKDLRVREHPSNGPYVQNLRRVTVKDVESLLAIVSEGTRRRRTAATKRNCSSSRSHALLELVTPRATLHLADLAGSEKGCWEGNTGGRQKEGANINKSLVALSNVISALVSGGPGRGRFVPYRDSALTWLLKDCFTGGGSTFIIATVSPSVACYGESASTLRWAARARRLPDTRANTSNVITKAALQAQLATLLTELSKHYIQYKPETGKLLYDDKHWELQIKKSDINNLETEAKIGNIMNIQYPKIDARNSESTPSSIASGSSDVINNIDKNSEISNEINKEIDKLFGPALERTRSGIDIEIVAPLRHKKRHFRSQEVLSCENPHTNNDHRLSDTGFSLGDKCIDDAKIQPPIPILYDNQRAEIIASVTERLYSKHKKNEIPINNESKPDKKSLNELKIMQPLNELKICSNARQRLMELSKKALRNKRKIGIPAHTQTKKLVIRVKDQAIDIQTDLQPYINNHKYTYKFLQDVSTETIPLTPRLKEVSVGSKYSNLRFTDSSTLTETKKVSYKNSSTMTNIILKSNHSTQTYVQPLPRRRKRLSAYSKYIRKIESHKSSTDDSNQSNASPIININISPMYAVESDSHSSDEVADSTIDVSQEKEKQSVTTTPDLLTNHNNLSNKLEEFQDNEESIKKHSSNLEYPKNESTLSPRSVEDFSDGDLSLPRVIVDGARKVGREDYNDLILGRNENLYPYNIKLSPSKEKHESKRMIRFKDIDVTPSECYSNYWQKKNVSKNSRADFEKYIDSDIESSNSSKSDSDSFVWKRSNSIQYTRSDNNTRRNKRDSFSKSKKELILLSDDFEANADDLDFDSKCSNNCWNKPNQKSSKQREHGYDYNSIEKKIKGACNSLEASVNKYDNYLANRKVNDYKSDSRTPTEYLQHLIKLRREAIKSECRD